MLRDFLVHLESKAWIFCFRVSKQGLCFTAPERRMEVTRDLYSLNLLVKLILLLHQIQFNLSIAAIAEAIIT